MSIDLSKYNLHSQSEEDKRALAVTAALAVIQAKVTNAPTYAGIVENEIKNLSKYADQIQEALKVKAE